MTRIFGCNWQLLAWLGMIMNETWLEISRQALRFFMNDFTKPRTVRFHDGIVNFLTTLCCRVGFEPMSVELQLRSELLQLRPKYRWRQSKRESWDFEKILKDLVKKELFLSLFCEQGTMCTSRRSRKHWLWSIVCLLRKEKWSFPKAICNDLGGYQYLQGAA